MTRKEFIWGNLVEKRRTACCRPPLSLYAVSALIGILALILILVVVLVLVLILVLVLVLVHDGHLLLYLRYRDSVTGIGENMHGSVQKNANGGAGVVPEGGIWYNAGIIF